jgi:hypothetical protein
MIGMKHPKGKPFGITRDPILGLVNIVYASRGHLDYVYGMFKGKETFRRDDKLVESWHAEGEQVPFTGHPTKGTIVLIMDLPDVREVTGEEAKAMIEKMELA